MRARMQRTGQDILKKITIECHTQPASTQELGLEDLRISVAICIYEASATRVEITSESCKNFILTLHISSSLSKAQLKREECQ